MYLSIQYPGLLSGCFNLSHQAPPPPSTFLLSYSSNSRGVSHYGHGFWRLDQGARSFEVLCRVFLRGRQILDQRLKLWAIFGFGIVEMAVMIYTSNITVSGPKAHTG